MNDKNVFPTFLILSNIRLHRQTINEMKQTINEIKLYSYINNTFQGFIAATPLSCLSDDKSVPKPSKHNPVSIPLDEKLFNPLLKELLWQDCSLYSNTCLLSLLSV
jgi:hypothetical protein